MEAVQGQRSNQLNYVPTRQINEMRNRQYSYGVARFAYRAWNCLCCPKERDSCPNRPQTASKFRRFRAVLRYPNSQNRELLAIQSSANPGKTISKTFANLCHGNILTASRRTRKTTFIFPSHGDPYSGDIPSVAGVPFVSGWRYNFRQRRKGLAENFSTQRN